MMEVNKFKIGLFTIGAVVVLFLTIFLINLHTLFEEKLALVTVYSESVQGLSVGSDVKFRGVPVGKVTQITILPTGQGICVRMEISVKAFEPVVELSPQDNGAPTPLSQAYFVAEVNKGLRAQLEMAGITGMKYIEIDYYVEPGTPHEAHLKPGENILQNAYYIPSQQSLMTGIRSSATQIIASMQQAIEKFNSIDFEAINGTIAGLQQGISEVRGEITTKSEQLDVILNRVYDVACNVDSASASLASFTSQLDYAEIQKTVDNVYRLTRSAEIFFSTLDTRIDNLELPELSAQARALLAGVDSNIRALDLRTRVKAVSASMDQMSADVRDAALSFIRLRDDLTQTLQQMRTPLNAISDLLERISRDPTILLNGARPPREKLSEAVKTPRS